MLPDNVQQMIRIVLWNATGALTTAGIIHESMREVVIATAVGLITLGWWFATGRTKKP
jgi:hypothetical protein